MCLFGRMCVFFFLSQCVFVFAVHNFTTPFFIVVVFPRFKYIEVFGVTSNVCRVMPLILASVATVIVCLGLPLLKACSVLNSFFSNVFSVYRILTYTVELLVLALSSDYTRYHSYRIVSYLQLPVWRLPASFVSKFILVSFYPILLFKSIVLLSPDFLRTLDYYYCPTSLYVEGFPSYFLGSKCQHSRVEQVRPAILFLRRY